ncbi:MAG: NAD(P)-binding protein, partial [Zoogloea sp.]|nr:NAD(P)-binding protein [Zoogloea sp.]
AILGSGIAGLSAAWRLAKEGHDDHLLVSARSPSATPPAGASTAPPALSPSPAAPTTCRCRPSSRRRCASCCTSSG